MKPSKRVFEIRPLPDTFTVEVRRYADGKWVPDDGEWDLAFIGYYRSTPICLYFDGADSRTVGWASSHPNNVAGRSGMDKMLREAGAANGFHAENWPGNPYLKAGLIRDSVTKEVLGRKK